MGMKEVMQALSEGAGRQSAIGGLMFQDAQMREGRAYEAAMAKEAERRANLEWRSREKIARETATTTAEALAQHQANQQALRISSQEGISAAGITSAESIAEQQRQNQLAIAQLGETGATKRTELLITGRADAAKIIFDESIRQRN